MTRNEPSWLIRLGPWLVFVVVAASHALSASKTPWDSRWSLPTAMSILSEGNTDLVEYGDLLATQDYYMIEWVDGRPYSFFPLGSSLWALPFVAVIDGALRVTQGRSYEEELRAGRIGDVEEFCASVAVGVAAAAVWLLCLEFGLPLAAAAVLTFLFAFGTSAWSTASRALWQHGPSLAALTWSLLLLVRGRTQPRLITLAALPLALSVLARPSNAVVVGALTVYVAWRHRRRLAGFVAVGLAVASLIAAYNYRVYGQPITTYVQPGLLEGGSPLHEALLGNLVSPARGLLVYTPLFLLCPLGAAYWWRDRAWRPLAAAVVAAVVLHWLTISQIGTTVGGNPAWWAGHCYGPRFFTDMSAFLVFLLIPLFGPAAVELRRRMASRVVFAGLALASVGIHAVGANVPAALTWNRLPNDIDAHRERIWDWSDPQFLRWHEPHERSS